MAKVRMRKVAPEIGEWVEQEAQVSAKITDATGDVVVFLSPDEWGFDVLTGKGWLSDAALARLEAATVARKATQTQ